MCAEITWSTTQILKNQDHLVEDRQESWAADAKEQQPKALLALQTVGFDGFREGQERIIMDVIAKKDG